jgi:hypothetical protein
LVEFMLAAPTLAFWDPRVVRSGMRQALTDILPPEILARQTKGDPLAASTRALRDWPDTLANDELLTPALAGRWELVRRGYLTPSALARALTARRETGLQPNIDFLSRWIHLEAWLRSLSSASAGVVIATSRLQERPHAQSVSTS